MQRPWNTLSTIGCPPWLKLVLMGSCRYSANSKRLLNYFRQKVMLALKEYCLVTLCLQFILINSLQSSFPMSRVQLAIVFSSTLFDLKARRRLLTITLHLSSSITLPLAEVCSMEEKIEVA